MALKKRFAGLVLLALASPVVSACAAEEAAVEDEESESIDDVSEALRIHHCPGGMVADADCAGVGPKNKNVVLWCHKPGSNRVFKDRVVSCRHGKVCHDLGGSAF